MARLLLGTVMVTFALFFAACSETDGDNGDSSINDDASETTEVSDEGDESQEDQADADDQSDSDDETASVTPEETATAEDDDAAESDQSDSEEQTRTIEHSLGETELTGVPERIVALEYTYAEDLLALGVQPVGVADVEGYETWVDIDTELDDSVADVGTRQEPSLDSIAELEPDLIIGVQFRHEPIYDELSDIAPTLIFNPYPEDESFSQFDEMEQTMMRIAEAVDQESAGQDVLDQMHETFDDVRSDIEDADVNRQFVLAQAFTSDSSPQMRLFIDTSMAVEILESLGLENAWDGEFDIYGFNTVGIETLATVEDASFMYVAQDDDNPFEDAWADNPVWNGLEFVEEDRVYALGGDTWLFGGPLSAEVLAEQVRDILLEAE